MDDLGAFGKVTEQVKEISNYLHLGDVKIDTIVFKLHYMFRLNISLRKIESDLKYLLQCGHFCALQSHHHDCNICWRSH